MGKTINDLVKEHPNKLGKLILKSVYKKNYDLYFTPMLKIGKYWFGWNRVYYGFGYTDRWSKGKVEMNIIKRNGEHPYWEFFKVAAIKVPKSHPTWIEINRLIRIKEKKKKSVTQGSLFD